MYLHSLLYSADLKIEHIVFGKSCQTILLILLLSSFSISSDILSSIKPPGNPRIAEQQPPAEEVAVASDAFGFLILYRLGVGVTWTKGIHTWCCGVFLYRVLVSKNLLLARLVKYRYVYTFKYTSLYILILSALFCVYKPPRLAHIYMYICFIFVYIKNQHVYICIQYIYIYSFPLSFEYIYIYVLSICLWFFKNFRFWPKWVASCSNSNHCGWRFVAGDCCRW